MFYIIPTNKEFFLSILQNLTLNTTLLMYFYKKYCSMKYFIYTLLGLSILLVGFNVTQINFAAPFAKDSFIAVIAVVAALCVIALSLILLTSKKIEIKYNKLKQ